MSNNVSRSYDLWASAPDGDNDRPIGMVWLESDRGVIAELEPGEARDLAERLLTSADYAEGLD